MLLETVLDGEGMADGREGLVRCEGVVSVREGMPDVSDWLQQGGAKDREVVIMPPKGDLKVVSEATDVATEDVPNSDKQLVVYTERKQLCFFQTPHSVNGCYRGQKKKKVHLAQLDCGSLQAHWSRLCRKMRCSLLLPLA